ncbi:hypothetical protein [Autumnicola psychrophila]|uniref:Lipoprotein n=1 Tax=Autumnicola psychrophila TaxID=3075592 RepID=A0ABU3DUP8_9FLAO|nr:hypothetical protein [Zunongwangia sp. F225]MDT0687440.1 hypothetical protein [Zunongwangia sp. F225]
MKKLFTFLFIGSMIASCSNDELNEVNEPETAVDLETQVAEGLYDNSNLGIYEGVFTTLDGKQRATVLIEMNGKDNPLVAFGFPDGQLKSFRSDAKASKASDDAIQFSGEDFSFDFSVEEDGSNPIVSNAIYMGKEGDVVIVKETSKAAVETKTGTYRCLNGCEDHPDLGKGGTQTFNSIATSDGMGNGADFILQVTLKNEVFPGTMTQTNCVANGRGATTCDLSGTIQGGSGPADVTGEHTYDNDNIEQFEDCSTLRGQWVYDSAWFGESSLVFESDSASGEECI